MKEQRIIIADNNKHFREGFKRILLNIGNVQVVGEAENGLELLQILEKVETDIIFMEINLQKLSGEEATRMVKAKYPGLTIIVLTYLENDRYIIKMLSAGADGYLSKARDNYDLFHEIIQNRNQRIFFSPDMKSNSIYNSISR